MTAYREEDTKTAAVSIYSNGDPAHVVLLLKLAGSKVEERETQNG